MAREKEESMDTVCQGREGNGRGGFKNTDNRPSKRTYSVCWNGQKEFASNLSTGELWGQKPDWSCSENSKFFQVEWKERKARLLKVFLCGCGFQASIDEKLMPWFNKPNLGILPRLTAPSPTRLDREGMKTQRVR